MCRAQAQGGQRCSSHARGRLLKSVRDYKNSPDADGLDKVMRAQAEYASTPFGGIALRAAADTARERGDEEQARMLERTLEKGSLLRERNREIEQRLRLRAPSEWEAPLDANGRPTQRRAVMSRAQAADEVLGSVVGPVQGANRIELPRGKPVDLVDHAALFSDDKEARHAAWTRLRYTDTSQWGQEARLAVARNLDESRKHYHPVDFNNVIRGIRRSSRGSEHEAEVTAATREFYDRLQSESLPSQCADGVEREQRYQAFLHKQARDLQRGGGVSQHRRNLTSIGFVSVGNLL